MEVGPLGLAAESSPPAIRSLKSRAILTKAVVQVKSKHEHMQEITMTAISERRASLEAAGSAAMTVGRNETDLEPPPGAVLTVRRKKVDLKSWMCFSLSLPVCSPRGERVSRETDEGGVHSRRSSLSSALSSSRLP